MQKKVKTLIASVLKPVDDTRMFEKLGISLQQSNKYAVNIIGFRSKNISLSTEIRLIPAFSFQRLSIHRFLAPWKFFWITLKLQPELLIITTHELLIPAMLYKIYKKNSRLLYDVQENYWTNMIYHGGFSKPLAFVLASWIRSKEMFSKTCVDLYILAEKGYAKEFSFSKNKHLLMLNKFRSLAKTYDKTIAKTALGSCKQQNSLLLVYTGTIHESYGIWQALGLAKELTKYLAIKLLVKGFSISNKLLKELHRYAAVHPWVSMQAENRPVPHADILQCLAQADFGLVCHQPIPSIKNCFPTRIYELMAYQKPILLQDHTPWTAYCERWDSAIALDFNNFDAKSVAEQMRNRKFYKFGPPKDIYWESEERKLLLSLDKLFNTH